MGGLVWVESQLATIMRSWSQIEVEASVAVGFATIAGHHQWHSEVIEACLPTSPALDAEAAVSAPTEGWEAATQRLAALTDPDATTARLKAVVRVVDPWLSREIGALQELARPVSDAPMQRWLRFVSIDHDDDGEWASKLLTRGGNDVIGFDEHVLIGELDLS